MFDLSGQHIVILTTIWWWKVRERLAVNKQRSHRFHMERFNFNKLNEVGAKEKYHIEVSNKFAPEVEINSDWEIIRENIREVIMN
jgi:hypothetical protein